MQNAKTLPRKLARVGLLIGLAALSFFVASFVASLLDFACLPYHRIVLSAIVVGSVAGLLAARRRSPVAVTLCIGLLASIAIYWLRPTSRGLFLQDLYAIKPGMTVAQVRQEMKSYEVRGQGEASRSSWPANRDGDESYIAYGHSRASEYNADVGAVVFRRGRVAYVDFSAD